MRLAAMNGLPVIYVFTHDSIAMGEDGPTHQPVEQLLGLRSIPGMVVIRPADANETAVAWRIAIERREGPVALVLTRQGLPVLDLARYPGITAGVPHGGYVLADSPSGAQPDIILIATGSELHLALEARDRLVSERIQARVVSLPSTNVFSMQSDQYRDKVLPPGVPLLAIEAGSSLGWRSYIGPQIAVIGVDTFGASAPGPVVMQHYGFTVENVCTQAHRLLHQVEEKSGAKKGDA
jgi:transketolase